VRDLSGEGGSAQLFRVAGYAFHLMNWLRRSQYCGTCGAEFIDKADELARICPACGRVEYPRISPATITAVIKDDSILLAHNRSFRAGRYGLIAGFVEPGETLEDCVRREILEETGITVRNISYIGSQPWPFPDSLMAGFTAEYDSGEVRADGSELSDARWFRRGELPEIPGTDSIAGRMIRRFEQRKLPELQKFAAPV
jgi:NAD+ diphosphatase